MPPTCTSELTDGPDSAPGDDGTLNVAVLATSTAASWSTTGTMTGTATVSATITAAGLAPLPEATVAHAALAHGAGAKARRGGRHSARHVQPSRRVLGLPVAPGSARATTRTTLGAAAPSVPRSGVDVPAPPPVPASRPTSQVPPPAAPGPVSDGSRSRLKWFAAPSVVAVSATVLAGAALTSAPTPAAEAAVPVHLLQAAELQRQTTTSDAWFEQAEVRAVSDARIEAERVAAAESATAEAARQAEEARRQAAEQAARDALRDPKGIAKIMVAERGWGEGQYSCLVSLWNKESGWQWDADNPSSSAYGIPQALPGSKMASAGADWETNPVTQITWGLTYIDNRYGTPCSAWAHSQATNWY